MKLEIDNYLTAVSTDYLFLPNPFGLDNDAVPPRIADRRTAFHLERGSIDRIRIAYALPDDLTVDQIPELLIIENDFGKYKRQFTRTEDGKLLLEREFALHEGMYKASEYSAFRAFYKKVVQADTQKLLIKSKS